MFQELLFLLDFLDLQMIAEGLGQILYGIFCGVMSGNLQNQPTLTKGGKKTFERSENGMLETSLNSGNVHVFLY